MSNPAELIEAASQFLNQKIIAAGIFALQDDYKSIAAFGAATAMLPETNSGVEAVEGVAAIEGSRALDAQKQGVTVRMIVAVTADNIYLLALPRFSGHEPSNLLMTFERAQTEMTVKKFGLSRRLTLKQGEQEISLTGATKGLSSEKAGDKAVLAALDLI